MDLEKIAIAPDIAKFFEEFVSDAIRVRKVQVTQAAVQYLVGLLCDCARPDHELLEALERPLTFLLRDALDAPLAERFKRLRWLGDSVLYVAGFFGSNVTRRGADRGYVLRVGASAYVHASAMLKMGSDVPHGTDVLAELGHKYEGCAGVLSDVADVTLGGAAHDDSAVLRLYERWLRTGSARLAERLGILGVAPAAQSEGLN